MDRHHAERVGDFLAEVFGGPPLYSQEGGSHIGMIVKHLGRRVSETQRAQWVALMVETADEIGLPAEHALRNVGRLSKLGFEACRCQFSARHGGAQRDWPMPKRGWGRPGGPWEARSGTEIDKARLPLPTKENCPMAVMTVHDIASLIAADSWPSN
jgi:hemoglobin